MDRYMDLYYFSDQTISECKRFSKSGVESNLNSAGV